MRRSTLTAASAVALVPLLVGTAGAPALAADEGEVVITNTETVSAKLDARGTLREARLYEQIAVTGTGRVSIANPSSTAGLRNLDGFGGYHLDGDDVVTQVDVDGQQRLRTVSDYDKDLPLGVEVTYTLDGKVVEPGAVVGKSGTLEVRYTVTNLTSRQDKVTYDDGTGTQVTTTAETVVPFVGQLTTTLPSTFTDVRSGEANIAGDGRGGSKVSFNLTLFPPIGASSLEVGYTAEVTSAVVPGASITALPVSPLENFSFKGGSASYAMGAEKGVTLTGGAVEIDTNLLKLRDGAAQLLAGLIQLRDGAAQLSAGLNDKAAPGAAELADGLNDKAAPGAAELAAGLNGRAAPGAAELAAGLNGKAGPGAARLAAGAQQLEDGLTQAGEKAPQLIDGLTQIDGGLSLVDQGLQKMYGDIAGLNAQAQPLHDGIAQLRAAIGTASTANTLLWGITQLKLGIATAANPDSATSKAEYIGTNLDAVNGGLQTVVDGLTALTPYVNPAVAANYQALINGLTTARGNNVALAGGVHQLSDALEALLANFIKLQCGLDNTSVPGACLTTTPGLLQGLTAVDAGVTALVSGVIGKIQAGVGVATDTKDDGTLRGGVNSLKAGIAQLNDGGETLLEGLGQLSAGAGELSDGAGELADGLQDAAAGSQELSDGLQEAADGSQELSNGLQEAADGSQELSDGLRDAADGSTQLADGLETAAGSAPQLVDGAQRLSDEGTSQVVESGKGTAEDFGVKYAVIEAGAERAATEGMAYGAPEGAAGATAYSLEIAGVDGQSASTAGRAVAAIALFAIGAGLATFLRRRFV